MIAIIKTEFQKMKRYHILLIGMVGMLCSPLLQLFSQAVVNEEFKRQNFNFAALSEMTLWGSAQIFMPVVFTLVGGYLINREYTDDTLKNILTIPLSFRKLLAGKLAAIGLLALILGAYCCGVTLIASILAGLPEIKLSLLALSLLQFIGLSFWIYLALLPLIAFCSRKPGRFMGGSMAAFIAGYCVLFFKSGLLRHAYPFSAALTLIGFDTAAYSGTSDHGSIPLAIMSMTVMFLIAVVLICTSEPPESARKEKKSKNRNLSLRPAQQKRQNAHHH